MKEVFFKRLNRVTLMLCLAAVSTGIFAGDYPLTKPENQLIQDDENNNSKRSGSAISPKVASTSSNESDEYVIGSNDLLDISIFRTSDLSRTVRVNSRGEINLPLIGVVVAGGLNSYELEKKLAEKYGESYLQNPQVSVFIKEYSSQKVVVEGSVNKPGVFPIVGKVSLLQVVALASGVDNIADTEKILVYRMRNNGVREVLDYNLAEIREGIQVDPEIIGGDVVVVGKSGIKSLWKGMTESLPWFALF